MAQIINYNTNTGQKLKPGESFVDKASGKTMTQGTVFGTNNSVINTVKSSLPVNTPVTGQIKYAGLPQSQLDAISKSIGNISKQIPGISAGIASLPKTNPLTSEPFKTSDLFGSIDTTGSAGAEADIISRLSKALSGANSYKPTTFDYAAEKAKLENERGVSTLKTQVADFDTELTKTKDLLANLKSRIQGDIDIESNRLAPKGIQIGRQAVIERQGSREVGDTTNAYNAIVDTRNLAEKRLASEQEGILADLNARAASNTAANEAARAAAYDPLTLLKTELEARQSTNDLLGLNSKAEAIKLSTIQDDSGNVYSFNPATGETKKIIDGSGKVSSDKIQIVGTENTGYFAYNMSTGEKKQIIGAVSPIAGTVTADTAKTDKAQSVLDAIDSIKTSSGSTLGMSSIFPVIPGTSRVGFEEKVSRLKSLLTLENMGVMKGVLSDSDMKVIKSASTALNTSMNSTDFYAELARVEAIMRKVASAGVQTSTNAGKTSTGAGWTIIQ